ncbi:MAG: hypothetical protein JNM30_12490 [Rhodospirillales bacterium]|nr:hypothetical protein [Rhodospirillales bacterium]
MILSAASDAPVAGADTARRQAAFLAVLAIFALFGLWVTAASRGNPAIGWMLMFAPGDFAAPGTLWPFLVSLQTAISPWLAALEVLAQRQFGTAAPVTVGLYRFCLVGAYLVAMAMAWPSLLRLAVATALSAVFLWATVLIHPATPIVYDVVLPFLLLAYFALLRIGAAPAQPHAHLVLAAAGFLLALAELTRPFMILFVPLLLVAAWFTLRDRARFVALALPVLLIAGAWHAHQWMNHGQLAWSNHAGFNLIRAWRMVPYPPLIAEPGNAPVAAERQPNLNTPEHGENSRRLRRAVLDYVLATPLESARHMAERVAVFVGAGHQIDDRVVEHPVLPAYDFVVRYADILALAGALSILVAMLAAPRRAGDMAGRIDNQAIAFVALSILVIAITESGEDARFQIGLLPLIALAPVPVLLRRDGAPRPWSPRTRAIAIAAAMLAVATIELLVSGAARQAMAEREGGRVVPPATGVATKGTIRVAQFNVRGGAWRDRDVELRATAACLQGIDLAGLVELRGGGPFGLKETQAAMLAGATGLAAIDAPAERRWWAPQFGNALLTRVPVDRWKSGPLPRALGISHRAMLEADAVVGGRSLRVIVAQVDNIDLVEQVAAIERAFRAAPSPAVLLADLSTSGRMEALASLVNDPAFVVVTNQPPMPDAGVQGGYVIAKGVRKVAQDFCKGGVSMSPRIAVELAFAP